MYRPSNAHLVPLPRNKLCCENDAEYVMILGLTCREKKV